MLARLALVLRIGAVVARTEAEGEVALAEAEAEAEAEEDLEGIDLK